MLHLMFSNSLFSFLLVHHYFYNQQLQVQGFRFPVRCSKRLAIVYQNYHSMAQSRLYYILYSRKGQISLAKLTYDRCGEEDPVLG